MISAEAAEQFCESTMRYVTSPRQAEILLNAVDIIRDQQGQIKELKMHQKDVRTVNSLVKTQQQEHGQLPLLVTINKTADGSSDYMQIISVDQFSLNIVLISPQITVNDVRPKVKK